MRNRNSWRFISCQTHTHSLTSWLCVLLYSCQQQRNHSYFSSPPITTFQFSDMNMQVEDFSAGESKQRSYLLFNYLSWAFILLLLILLRIVASMLIFRSCPEPVLLNVSGDQESIPVNSASLCSLAGRSDNPIPTRFLAPQECLKNPALTRLTKYFLIQRTGKVQSWHAGSKQKYN